VKPEIITDLNDIFKQNKNDSKKSLFGTYIDRLYNNNTTNINNNMCNTCNIEMIVHISEGQLMCKHCGFCEKTAFDIDKLNKEKSMENK
jgi:hypothetical protein